MVSQDPLTCKVRQVYSLDLCGFPVVENNRCEKHSKQTCTSCGEPVDGYCNEDCSIAICGFPLCNNCGPIYEKGKTWHTHGRKKMKEEVGDGIPT